MTQPFISREQKILELLHQQTSISIQELVDELGVSNMTIHRDLNRMAEAGYVHKKHGGVILAGRTTSQHEHACAMCNKPVASRTIFILQFENGEKKYACCAHCGLMMQSESNKVKQSLTADYLYGHIVSANLAYFIMGSELNICCVPSILSFGSLQDAEEFQKGFGGKLLSMEKATKLMNSQRT
jgi:DeoR/GlpR family transcriptional regulator of sugar metabolism